MASNRQLKKEERTAKLDSPLHKTKKISFKMFQQRESIHFKSLYPFLTKTQINNKVREKWKCMSQSEKLNYCVTVLTKTPPKPSPTQRKRQSYPISGRSKCSIWSGSKEEKRKPGYQSDFSSPSIHQNITGKQNKSPAWLRDPTLSSNKDYSKAKYHIDNSVPEIIDETPSKQQGILRQPNFDSLNDTETKKKNRVSFSPKKETSDSKDDEISEADSESLGGNSSEEDCTLIRRNATNFDEIDNFQMYVEGDEIDNEIPIDSTTRTITKKSDNLDSSISSSTADPNNAFNKKKQMKNKSKGLSAEVLKTRKTRSTPLMKKSDEEDFNTPYISHDNYMENATPLVGNNEVTKDGKYTTPMMDNVAMETLMQQAKKAPKKRQSVTVELESNGQMDKKKRKSRTSLLKAKEDLVDASGDAKIFTAEPLDHVDKVSPDQLDEEYDNEKDFSNPTTDEKLNSDEKHWDDESEDEKLSNDESEDTNMMKFDVPNFSTSGPYFQVPENYNLDDFGSLSSSSDDEVFDTFKSTSNNMVTEALKRMQAAVLVRPSPVRSPETSPKILSPALSGISQLSGASSNSSRSFSSYCSNQLKKKSMDEKQTVKESSKKEEDTSKIEPENPVKSAQMQTTPKAISDILKECSNNKNKINDDSEKEDKDESKKDMKLNRKRVTQKSTARKIPTKRPKETSSTGEPLCDLFYDMTPPEEKRKKQSSRRLLASAVTQGNNNFHSLFDSNNDAIF